MIFNEFTIVCTGKDGHNKRELRQLTRGILPGQRVAIGDPSSLEFDWAEWSATAERNRHSPAGNPVHVVAKRPAVVGDASSPWMFGCDECERQTGSLASHMPYRISDANLEKVVRAYLALGKFEFDISKWGT